ARVAFGLVRTRLRLGAAGLAPDQRRPTRPPQHGDAEEQNASPSSRSHGAIIPRRRSLVVAWSPTKANDRHTRYPFVACGRAGVPAAPGRRGFGAVSPVRLVLGIAHRPSR